MQKKKKKKLAACSMCCHRSVCCTASLFFGVCGLCDCPCANHSLPDFHVEKKTICRSGNVHQIGCETKSLKESASKEHIHIYPFLCMCVACMPVKYINMKRNACRMIIFYYFRFYEKIASLILHTRMFAQKN
jgi:hypothetical protein